MIQSLDFHDIHIHGTIECSWYNRTGCGELDRVGKESGSVTSSIEAKNMY